MAKGRTRKLKLSKNMKPFISRVVTGGNVQEAFKESTGKPVGACVKAATDGKVGELTGAQIHKIASKCAKDHAAKTLNFPGVIHNGPGAKLERARKRAAVNA